MLYGPFEPLGLSCGWLPPCPKFPLNRLKSATSATPSPLLSPVRIRPISRLFTPAVRVKVPELLRYVVPLARQLYAPRGRVPRLVVK